MREPIEIRCFNLFIAEGMNSFVALVVGKDEQNFRCVCSVNLSRSKRDGDRKQHREDAFHSGYSSRKTLVAGKLRRSGLRRTLDVALARLGGLLYLSQDRFGVVAKVLEHVSRVQRDPFVLMRKQLGANVKAEFYLAQPGCGLGRGNANVGPFVVFGQFNQRFLR